MKNTIVYLNPDCFSQVDDTVLCHLTKEFNVHWFYLYGKNDNTRLGVEKAQNYANENGIILHAYPCPYRGRDVRNVLYYNKIAKSIRSINPDLIYHCERNPYFALATWIYLSKFKKILGVHDAKPHSYEHDFSKWLAVKTVDFAFGLYNNFITFSEGQKNVLKDFRGLDSVCVGMSCKSFGKSHADLTDITEGIKLLFFGTINNYKGLDILIDALETLKDEGITNYSLTIAGQGSYWPYCEKKIKTANIYNKLVRFINNDEVPDLMSSHHFLVLPYRNVTQSGPLFTSIAYDLPVIAPNIGCFHDICNEKSSILYEQGNLLQTLRELSAIENCKYNRIRTACSELRESTSESKIAKNYIDYFNSVINHKSK